MPNVPPGGLSLCSSLALRRLALNGTYIGQLIEAQARQGGHWELALRRLALRSPPPPRVTLSLCLSCVQYYGIAVCVLAACWCTL
eukprot:4806979-Alexandrium_andersonii.AAC.1